jgi:large subunit ribosomal protein L20
MGYKYSDFLHNLNKHNIQINRKILSELSIKHPDDFKEIVDKVMK